MQLYGWHHPIFTTAMWVFDFQRSGIMKWNFIYIDVRGERNEDRLLGFSVILRQGFKLKEPQELH